MGCIRPARRLPNLPDPVVGMPITPAQLKALRTGKLRYALPYLHLVDVPATVLIVMRPPIAIRILVRVVMTERNPHRLPGVGRQILGYPAPARRDFISART